MSRTRKNKLKKKINNCLLCGKHLETNQDKIAYRIDKNKGYLLHNVVIICDMCHNIFIDSREQATIYNICLNIKNIESYFKKFGKDFLLKFYEKYIG